MSQFNQSIYYAKLWICFCDLSHSFGAPPLWMHIFRSFFHRIFCQYVIKVLLSDQKEAVNREETPRD